VTVALRRLELAGSARERGRTHGEELRGEIDDALERWRAALARDVGEPGAYLERFLAETDFPKAIGRWAPDLWEEVRGLGEGAGLAFEDCLAYQLMDEEWWYRTRVMAGRCSAIAVFDEKPRTALLAQNMDLPAHYDGSQVLLHVKSSATAALVFSAAGLIALDGLNDHAVGVCCNSLPQLRTSPRGLPVAFVLREVLARPSLAEAEAFVRTVPHASGQNYLVGGPERVVSLECSADAIARYSPHPTRIVHTNHPLVNGDRTDDPTVRAGADAASFTETERRHGFLAANLDERPAVSPTDVMELLSDRTTPVCKVPTADQASITLGSLVMELADEPVLHLAPGPPSETPYTAWRFTA
jgi:isopenicillin-N N-acyltransferase like protein